MRPFNAPLRALALAAALAWSPAQAHDTSILPAGFAGLKPVRLAPGVPLNVHVSAGHGLTPLNGPRRVRLGQALLLGAGPARPPRRFRYGPRRSQLGFGALPGGVWCLGLRTPLAFIELDDEITGRYLAEVQVPAAQAAHWAAQRARGEPWREWYAKDAVTWACSGAGAPRDWRRRAAALRGLKPRLVILPLRNPTRLRARGALAVELRLDGRPVGDVALRVFDRSVHGGQRERVVRTDARGRAVLPLARRGPCLVATTVLETPRAAGEPWRSRFGTLGFQVGRPR
jgi:hypothetical protein